MYAYMNEQNETEAHANTLIMPDFEFLKGKNLF